MATRKKQAAPGSGFDSHLLNIEETWWVRAHPFNARCVRVKQGIRCEMEMSTVVSKYSTDILFSCQRVEHVQS